MFSGTHMRKWLQRPSHLASSRDGKVLAVTVTINKTERHSATSRVSRQRTVHSPRAHVPILLLVCVCTHVREVLLLTEKEHPCAGAAWPRVSASHPAPPTGSSSRGRSSVARRFFWGLCRELGGSPPSISLFPVISHGRSTLLKPHKLKGHECKSWKPASNPLVPRVCREHTPQGRGSQPHALS